LSQFNPADHPHRRYNPLTREWILVSPHRSQRPWLGQVEKAPAEERPRYDPHCYLCPGNERAGGQRNPDYAGTFVFDNDFSALLMDAPDPADPLSLRAERSNLIYPQGTAPSPGYAARNDDLDARPGPVSNARSRLLVARRERGICRVVCFSPRHDLTMAEMELPDIRAVVDVWTEQFAELGAHPHIDHVQIFENKGSMMGASNPHPHGQIWASQTLPHVPATELAAQSDYWQEQGRCLLCDVLALEESLGERIVCSNEQFVVLVPFWATWPFETLLLCRRHVPSLLGLTQSERDGLADIMRRLTTRYDNLFEVSFPYSMGFHQPPTDRRDYPGWHLHAHYYPPLLRSATVRKFMVGYEMLAEPQRDIPAEAAAARLRELPEVHYRRRE
jgi:UDPglucose--hexose-1-phosphate uridylyltransferase